jgi:hypothetical protein
MSALRSLILREKRTSISDKKGPAKDSNPRATHTNWKGLTVEGEVLR